MVQHQYNGIKSMEHEHPGIGHVVRDADGRVLLDDDETHGSVELQLAKTA